MNTIDWNRANAIVEKALEPLDENSFSYILSDFYKWYNKKRGSSEKIFRLLPWFLEGISHVKIVVEIHELLGASILREIIHREEIIEDIFEAERSTRKLRGELVELQRIHDMFIGCRGGLRTWFLGALKKLSILNPTNRKLREAVSYFERKCEENIGNIS